MVVASDFEILPAIDLRGGRVVRLEQGDFARETAFSDDPVEVAQVFSSAGARWLHVVDLDGARSGTPVHASAIAAIIGAVDADVRVEVAGGLRTAEAAALALDGGAARVVLGTTALREPALVADEVRRHGPDRVAVAIDVRSGEAVGDGWLPGGARRSLEDAMTALADVGVETFEVTAIDRDGLGTGPDLDLYRRLVDRDVGRIIASGGIATTVDIARVRSIGCAGAIIGRALYDGRLRLADALVAARSPQPR